MRRVAAWLLSLLVVAACGGGSGAPLAPADAGASDGSPRIDAGPQLPRDAGARDAQPPDAGPPPDAGEGGPPYPIVLCHGFFGFEDFAGVDFATYFYGVKDDLAAHGEPLVFTPAVDPFDDSTVRGAELVAQVEEILAATGAARVNLVGHSQGGLDVRYVASTRPELVASVTTIASPHRGTPIADVVLGIVRDERARELADALVRLVGAPLYDAVGEQTSVVAALRQLSTEGAAAFSQRYPDAPGVLYLSLTGRSALAPAGPACATTDEPPFLARYDGAVDTLEPLLAVPHAIVAGDAAEPVVSDGLVPVSSARWGTFLGCFPADHLDEIGHLFGDRPGITNDLDHRELYRDLVAYLRSRGL